jgi:hypothetical protein
MALNIEKLIDLVPASSDFEFKTWREGFHYFCALEIKGSYSISLNSSSNALKTAFESLVEELKSKLTS